MKKLLPQSLFAVAFTFFATIAYSQQTGNIKGHITTSDNKPAQQVNVTLKGTTNGATTNDNGDFQIRRVRPGSYEIIISAVGVKTQYEHITIIAGQTISADFMITESASDLNEVTISGSKINKFARKDVDGVARMPLTNIENPQVYSVITNQLLKEQIAVDPREALKNAPGAAVTTFPAGGFGITSRGFATGINARNGLETAASRSSIDIANVDHIEVIKGPSGTLFGSTIASFGGVVNLVTKKPTEDFKGELSYVGGSYGFNRFTADINTPLNKDKTILARINVASNKQNSFLDNGHNNTTLVAPSIIYKVNDRLTLHGDAEFYNVDQTRVMYTRVTPASGFTNPADIPLPYNRSLYLDDANAKTNSDKVFLEANYQLSDNWRSTTLYSFVGERADKSYQYYPTWISPTRVARNILLYGPIFNNYTNLQENINGEFHTGTIKHKMLIGANYRYYHGTFNYATAPANKFIDTVDITKTYTAVSKNKIDQFLTTYGSVVPFAISDQYTYSAYATDVVEFTDRLSTLLSLRVDRYNYKGVSTTDGYGQTSVAPKLGLVYQVVKDQFSVFGNYMSGFQNIGPINQPNGMVLTPKPTFAKQGEGGIKVEAFNKMLNFTASYYYIDINNATRTDGNGFTTQDGEQVSKGLETELIANPAPGLNILAGYTYNSNRIVKTSAAAKAYEGNFAAGAPQNIGNLWISYKFQQFIKNVGIGFGGNYVDKAYFATDNVYFIPSYTVVNAAAFYDTPKWRFDFKVNNIGNKKYWDLYGAPNALVNVLGSITFKF